MKRRSIRDAGLSGSAAGLNQLRWQAPRAIDVRFGMEITLYIARR